MADHIHDGVLGSLLLAGMGDALGAPTEQWTIDEILDAHGGLVTAFRTPPPDTFAGANAGRRAEVTDDASQMYYLARHLIEHGGRLAPADWLACLLDWATTSPKAGFMGPSTLPVVQALRAGADLPSIGVIGTSARKMTSFGITNGAAMRVAPIGLCHPGDLEAAASQTLVTCLPSHDTDVAIAAACAMAAAASAAVLARDPAAVIAAARRGARHGAALARTAGRRVPGPSFAGRLELALAIAARETNDLSFLRAIDAEIGASVLAVESVPAALAIFAYAEGDPFRTISLAATVGNDTDSVAAMAGALAGALRGAGSLPSAMLDEFRAVNDATYAIDDLARGLASLASRDLDRRAG